MPHNQSHILEQRNLCWSQYKPSFQKLTNLFEQATETQGFKIIKQSELVTQFNLNNVTVNHKPKVFICRCMDERCQQKYCEATYHRDELIDIALPGMGSLLTFAELAKHAEIVLKKAKANNVESIELYSHEGCGAAAIAKSRYEKITRRKNPPAKEIEIFFGERAYNIFKQVNKDGQFGIYIVAPMYQSADQMLKLESGKSPEIHPALGISIIDFNGLDLSTKRPSIPNIIGQAKLPLFYITDYGEEFDDVDPSETTSCRSTAKEVELAGKIIQGDHGMGEDFDYPIVFWVNSLESKKRAIELRDKIDIRINRSRNKKLSKHEFVMIDFT
jgi:hypothetical protein